MCNTNEIGCNLEKFYLTRKTGTAADRTQGTRVDFVEPQRGKRQSTPLPLTRDTVSIAPTAAKTIMKNGTSSTTTCPGDSTANSNAGPDDKHLGDDEQDSRDLRHEEH